MNKDESKKLKERIKVIKKKNLKNTAIKNLKIYKKAIELVYPYVIIYGLIAGFFKIFGLGFPFYRDDFKYYAYTMEEFDSLGNIRVERQYKEYDNKKNTLNIYSKWQKEDNGLYSRTIKKYELKDISEENIFKLLDGKENIENYINNIHYDVFETKNNLSQDEIDQKEYLQIILFDKNSEEFICVKETVKDNLISSTFYIFFVILFGLYLSHLRPYTKPSLLSEFSSYIDKIKKEYEKIDTKELKKKLYLKNKKY